MPKIIDWESRFEFLTVAMKSFRNQRAIWPTLRELADSLGWNLNLTRNTLERMAAAGLAYVGAASGCTVAEIAQALGVEWGQVNYHVQKLRSLGLLGGGPGKLAALALPRPGAGPERLDWRQLWVLETLAYVRQHPGCTVKDLVAVTGLTRRAVRARMRRLHRAGAVRLESYGVGGENHYFVG